MALIVDTGPLYAALDRSDADHAACRHLLESTTESLVVPAPVLVEVAYRTHRRLGEPKLATLDRHLFGTLRPRHGESPTLLPLDAE